VRTKSNVCHVDISAPIGGGEILIIQAICVQFDVQPGVRKMSDTQDIMSTLEEYAAAYCDKDLSRLMSIFVAGDDISLIGTGADELCSGPKAVAAVFERNFRDATATRFEWTWTHISVHDATAVAAVALNIHLNTPNGPLVVPVRWTVALIMDRGNWLWIHRHASAAAASQKGGTAYPK
jgi:ketosteroid isomerase-like protein